ncbi:MAG TPA: VOC family protein [Solirubrobacteraceae bacterium]
MSVSPTPTSTAPGPETAAIAAGTTLGAVSLAVSDLSRSRAFYETVLGLRGQELEDGGVAFGAADAAGPMRVLVRLYGDAAAPALDRSATGLYHLAILLPTRADLGHALTRLAETRWPLDGASDHLVSEALYLADPDGNGIEIYRDRTREEWGYDGDRLEMATLALDLRSIIAELGPDPAPQPTVPAATAIGHVHLQVADIDAAEAFYHGVLGFDVTVRGYPGALFVSAGGYHHHLGLNTWHSRGSDPAAAGAVGLRSYEVLLPDVTERDRVLARVRAAGLTADTDPSGAAAVHDPSGNLVVLRCQ